MKRRLLIILLCVFAFACLFATSVFATVNYNETATLADGTVLPIYDEDNNPLIWYVSGTDENGNNVYSSVPNNRNGANENNDTYVTYTIDKSWMTQLKDVNFHVFNGSEYEVINDKTYDVVVLNLRGLTSFQYINKGLGIAPMQYVYFNEILKDFCDTFQKSKSLRLIDLSECTDLSGGFGGVCNLQECSNLHTVRLAPGTSYSLKCNSNRNYRFKQTAITEIVIPSNITNLGVDNFNGCARLESIYIMGNTTSLGQRNFAGCTSLTNIYILGDNPTIDLTSFKENFFECVDAGKTLDFKSTGKYFFFVTTNEEYLSGVVNAIGADGMISYDDYITSPESYVDGRYVIFGTNICDVYYGNHEIDENNSNECAGVCRVCGETVVNHAEEAALDVNIVYASFDKAGTKTVSCTSEGCTYCVTEKVDPLFVNLGFSASQYGDMMSVNYKVNAGPIAEYEKITGETVNYGVFAVKAETIGKNDIFDENGAEREGVIAADITDAGFNLFNLKIMGFDEKQKDIDLAMGAFVKTTKDGEVEYSYLQIDEPTNGKYYLASYNEVVELAPKDKEESAQ